MPLNKEAKPNQACWLKIILWFLFMPELSKHMTLEINTKIVFIKSIYYDTHACRPQAISLAAIFLCYDVAGVGRKMPKSQFGFTRWIVKGMSDTTWMDLHVLYFAQHWRQACDTSANPNWWQKSTVNPTDLGEMDLCYLGVDNTQSHWWPTAN